MELPLLFVVCTVHSPDYRHKKVLLNRIPSSQLREI